MASQTGNVVTIRDGSTNNWLKFTAFAAPTASMFVNGRLFVCSATVTTSGTNKLVLTGDDVDVKANVLCAANRP